MWIQQSYRETVDVGTLYLVPTPIGNLDDMTYRAVQVLQTVDVIAAEDTRNTRKLCDHFEIQTRLVSYHEHNKYDSGRHVLALLQAGQSVAIVTDAGMPAISDPGTDLVQWCVAQHISVVPLPGANAALTALIGSGLLTDTFYFYGFLPRKQKDQKQVIQVLQTVTSSIILYEAPHRLKATLRHLQKLLGNRQVTLVRELTKIYETWYRGTLSSLTETAAEMTIKGECCLVIEGAAVTQQKEQAWWSELSIEQHVHVYQWIHDWSNKAAIKQAAQDRDVPKREVYNVYHADKET